jgi:predicted ATP-grasp superfamily ATP-dependent carboligase
MNSDKNTRHWFVAGWPGMSNVAVIACGYLVKQLGLEPVAVIDGAGRTEAGAVAVRGGHIQVPTPPQTMLYSGKIGEDGPTVTVLIAEAQPESRGMTHARDLLDRVRQDGADHVLTFASVATQLEPMQAPKVYGAATTTEMVDELAAAEIGALSEGEIGGMNGVMVGAASIAGLPGVCLLGEIPYYAAQIANPAAASAVVEAFTKLTGVEVDRAELDRHAERVNKLLLQLRERMQTGSTEPLTLESLEEEEEEESGASPEPDPAATPKKDITLDLTVRRKIEELFDSARKDHSRGVELKAELDKLGVFKQYEDRFLDLYRRAG